MSSQAADLARCLARDAEAVCRHYLSNGRRQGRYWLIGDVANTPGRSLFVRLTGPDSGKGAAGKWTDAATGQHGDLLDLIALNRGLERLRDVLARCDPFSACHGPNQPPIGPRANHRHRTDRPNPHDGCSRWHARFRAQSQKRICASAALRLCTGPQHCAFIPAAITDPMPTRRPRSGRR